MCGIAGFVDLRGERRVERETLVRMADALRHRGPDSCGYFTEGDVGLGFRRLSIIDVEGGDQPIFNEDGSLVLICNGEIYNHDELRRGLRQRGHAFRTNSDVEVLLHLYEEEGVLVAGEPQLYALKPGDLESIAGQPTFEHVDGTKFTLLKVVKPGAKQERVA